MSPRPDVSDERRNLILDTATKVFARFGFNKARMEDVAEEAAISKGLLYWYFKSKDEIISAILDRFFAFEMGDFKILADKSLTAEQRLLKFSQELISKAEKLALLLPISLEFYALAARQNAVRASLKNYFRQYRILISELVQDGIESGEFKQVNPDEAAITIMAVMEGIYLLAVIDSEGFKWQQQCKTSIQLILNGLKKVS